MTAIIPMAALLIGSDSPFSGVGALDVSPLILGASVARGVDVGDDVDDDAVGDDVGAAVDDDAVGDFVGDVGAAVDDDAVGDFVGDGVGADVDAVVGDGVDSGSTVGNLTPGQVSFLELSKQSTRASIALLKDIISFAFRAIGSKKHVAVLFKSGSAPFPYECR